MEKQGLETRGDDIQAWKREENKNGDPFSLHPREIGKDKRLYDIAPLFPQGST
jgi:hypothetical protein